MRNDERAKAIKEAQKNIKDPTYFAGHTVGTVISFIVTFGAVALVATSGRAIGQPDLSSLGALGNVGSMMLHFVPYAIAIGGGAVLFIKANGDVGRIVETSKVENQMFREQYVHNKLNQANVQENQGAYTNLGQAQQQAQGNNGENNGITFGGMQDMTNQFVTMIKKPVKILSKKVDLGDIVTLRKKKLVYTGIYDGYYNVAGNSKLYVFHNENGYFTAHSKVLYGGNYKIEVNKEK